MGIFSGLFRSRDKPKDSYDSPSYSYFFGRTHAGKRVNDRTAMQIIAVYACVRVLSEAIAQLPLHVYQYTDNGKERVPKHPLYFLLHDQPNPEMTSFIFRETLMAHLLIYGNAYAQIIRNGRGEVLGLYPLMPDKVRVDRDDHGRLIYRYSRYDEHNPNFRQQGEILLPMEQVLHIPGLGFDGLVGYSPIAMAKNAIGLAVACDEYGASFFANGASPSAVLEHPGVIKNPERVREAWQRAYGSGNAHKTAILEEGMKYTPISIPNNEAQFLETRKFQIEEIARLYRVPLHIGNHTARWEEVFSCWAAVSVKTSTETTDAGVTKEVVSLEFTVRQTPDTKKINTTTHKLRFRGLVYDINGVLPNYKSLDYMKITAGTRKAGEQDDFD